jgi:hypothetical protein
VDLFDDTGSEQHRRQCEARFALSMPLQARRLYLASVESKRGKPARLELESEMITQWTKNKSTKA